MRWDETDRQYDARSKKCAFFSFSKLHRPGLLTRYCRFSETLLRTLREFGAQRRGYARNVRSKVGTKGFWRALVSEMDLRLFVFRVFVFLFLFALVWLPFCPLVVVGTGTGD